jgi:hypothetical protein
MAVLQECYAPVTAACVGNGVIAPPCMPTQRRQDSERAGERRASNGFSGATTAASPKAKRLRVPVPGANSTTRFQKEGELSMQLAVQEWCALIDYGLGIARSRGYRSNLSDRDELQSVVTEIIADALKDPKCPLNGALREWIKKKLRNRLRAYGRSIRRRRRRETEVAHRPGRLVDRRSGDLAKMRAALQTSQEVVLAPTPAPWKLIETLNRAWLEEQLRLRSLRESQKRKYRRRFLRECGGTADHVDLSPLQEPCWSPRRERDWENSWTKCYKYTASVVPRKTTGGDFVHLPVSVNSRMSA